MKMPDQNEGLVEVKNLYKNFGVTVALNHINMKIKRGEVRGLIGENGSGKSTISSIVAGIQTKSSGEMYYQGQKWEPVNSLEAIRNGIGMIVQEAGTVANITVAENIFMGNYQRFKTGPYVNKKKMIIAAKEALKDIGVTDIDPSLPTYLYDMQQRKLIEIARTMYNKPELFIVDETTTALSHTGREILYNLMHKAAKENKAVVFISHDLEELMEHCDTLTILRDGDIVDNVERENYNASDIKHKMIGREIEGHYYRIDHDGYDQEVILRAENITTMKALLNFSLELHKGEILGIGGLSACGMHELGKALYGIEEVVHGQVTIRDGITIKSAKQAMKNGVGYISKNRDTESLELNASIAANIQSTGFKKNQWFGPLISGKKEREYAKLQVDQLAIKCVNMYQPVRALSGGNKQKVVFGKWIAVNSDIMIMDCPTRGVDIGVKAAMYQLIYKMKKEGKSIIMISEEMPELMGMSDRLLIMKDGEIKGEFHRKDEYDSRQMIECMI